MKVFMSLVSQVSHKLHSGLNLIQIFFCEKLNEVVLKVVIR